MKLSLNIYTFVTCNCNLIGKIGLLIYFNAIEHMSDVLKTSQIILGFTTLRFFFFIFVGIQSRLEFSVQQLTKSSASINFKYEYA